MKARVLIGEVEKIERETIYPKGYGEVGEVVTKATINFGSSSWNSKNDHASVTIREGGPIQLGDKFKLVIASYTEADAQALAQSLEPQLERAEQDPGAFSSQV